MREGHQQTAAWRKTKGECAQEENTYSETKKALKTPNRGRTHGQGNRRRKREDFEGLTKEGGGRKTLHRVPANGTRLQRFPA